MALAQESAEDSELSEIGSLSTTIPSLRIGLLPATVDDLRQVIERISPFTSAFSTEMASELGEPDLGRWRVQ